MLYEVITVEGSRAHAKDSARVVNAIDPHFLATLTLMVGPDPRIYEEKVMGGRNNFV